MVNPPDNPEASVQTAPDNPPDPQEWLGSATRASGSWWDDYLAWPADRSTHVHDR